MENWLKNYVREHIEVINKLDQGEVARLIETIRQVRDQNKQIFIAGNGGGAACGSHLTVDLGKTASLECSRRFKVFSLSDVPWMTAIANDISYDSVFSQQMENFCQEGDLLIVFTVSGSSPNILEAVKAAKSHKMLTAAVVGDRNGPVIPMVDIPIVIKSRHFAHVEDMQSAICHMIAFYFREKHL